MTVLDDAKSIKVKEKILINLYRIRDIYLNNAIEMNINVINEQIKSLEEDITKYELEKQKESLKKLVYILYDLGAN